MTGGKILSAAAALTLAALFVVPVPAASSTPAHDRSHVLVSFGDGVSGPLRDAVHEAAGGRVVNRLASLDIDVVRVPDGVTAAATVARYRGSGVTDYAALNRVVRLLTEPNDALFGQQWGFHNTGQRVAGSLVTGTADFDIDAPEGWGAAFGPGFENTGGTRVAILDTGIDRTHADLLGKVVACASATAAIGVIVEGTCSDDNLHGTHVAGTVAANTGNAAGVAGTAPNAELAIFKMLNAAGVGFLADELAGIEWAWKTAGARVISMSFGADSPDAEEEQAFEDAHAAGALPVAAAGNDGDSTRNWPAAYPIVMSVAATSANGDIADFSVCNSDVEIAAPGEDVWSTFPANAYGVISGTSMATPHVSGVAALVMSEKGLSNTQTRNQLVNTATEVTGNDGRSACSNIDQVNLATALGALDTQEPPPPEPGAIGGTVTSQSTGAGIGGAAVDCGSAGAATTASSGDYLIGDADPGTHSCTASASGYRSKSRNVTVESGITTDADFALRSGGGNSPKPKRR